jgi:hypothetical protein
MDPAGTWPQLFPAPAAVPPSQPGGPLELPPLPPQALESARDGAFPELAVSTGTSRHAQAAELAFQAHLIPIPVPDGEPAGDRPDSPWIPTGMPSRPRGAAPLPFTIPESSAEVEVTLAPIGPATGQAASHREGSSPLAAREKDGAAPPERSRKPDTAPQPAALGGAASKLVPHLSHAAETRTESATYQPHSAAEPSRPEGLPEPEAEIPPSRPPGVARDIKFEVNGGDRRVEVRLVERGGEVHVAVRTPDARLASALREDLPALSSRLAESGFRTETWHPAAPGGLYGASDGPREGYAQPSAGGSPHDPNPGSRQEGRQQQGDAEPRQDSSEQPNPKEKGKEFAWFISSLR